MSGRVEKELFASFHPRLLGLVPMAYLAVQLTEDAEMSRGITQRGTHQMKGNANRIFPR